LLSYCNLKEAILACFYMSGKNQEFLKNVNEQAGVEGQRKEVNVGDYPKAAASLISKLGVKQFRK
jgi:hypothetical protein